MSLESKSDTATVERQEGFEAIARENFSCWNEALQTRDPKTVAALYTEEATFLPTVSRKFAHGQFGAEEYFEHFLQKNPNGEIIDERIQVIGADCYLHSGMYNFTVDSDGERKVVEARFTFGWKKNEQGEWKIFHHHSSVRPQA